MIVISCVVIVCVIHYFGLCIAAGREEHQQAPIKHIGLEDAIRIAIEKNPQLQSAKYQIDVAAGALRQSQLYPNPVLEFLTEEMPTSEIGLNQSQNLVAITQPIITAGKRSLAIQITEKEKEKNELERNAILLDIISDTKKAFYKVIANQEGFNIATKVRQIAQDIYKSEKIRFESGEVAFTNVLRAEVELSKAANLVSITESRLQNSISELKTVMGIPDGDIEGVLGELIKTPVELSFHELELEMKKNQPFLKAFRKNIEIAETQVRLEKRQAIPDIFLSAGYKRLSREDIDTIQLGIGIPTPIFNRNQGNIEKSKALSRKARSENTKVYNDFLLLLRKNFNLYNAERRRVAEFTNTILPRAEESLTLINRGYKEGEFDYIDLLDAQRTWAETRISYIESVKQLNLIIAEIERLAVIKIGKQ